MASRNFFQEQALSNIPFRVAQRFMVSMGYSFEEVREDGQLTIRMFRPDGSLSMVARKASNTLEENAT